MTVLSYFIAFHAGLQVADLQSVGTRLTLADRSRRKEMATSTEVAIFTSRTPAQPLKRWAILPNAAVPP